MKILIATALLLQLHGAFAWESLREVPACEDPHRTLCSAEANPNLARLKGSLEPLRARLLAHEAEFNRDEATAACAGVSPAECQRYRAAYTWYHTFSPEREDQLLQIFAEVKESATRFLVQRRAETLEDAELPADLKADRLELLDQSLWRVRLMKATIHQTAEALNPMSPREATRYFHDRSNTVEFGFLSLLPEEYDDAIRVILGHEVAHSFGPHTIFSIQGMGDSTEVEGVSVRSFFRASYPLMSEVAQLPPFLQGADVACLEKARDAARADVERTAPYAGRCDDSRCAPLLQRVNQCRKDCRDAPDVRACEEGCAPLMAEHRACVEGVCTPEERRLGEENTRARARFTSLVPLIANPHTGGNRYSPECGRAQTEESLGDHLGIKFLLAGAPEDPERDRLAFEVTATAYCQFVGGTGDTVSTGPHPPTSERINDVHFAFPRFRRAYGCARD